MSNSETLTHNTSVCPWWLIYSFDNPLRRLVQKPERILADLVQPGDRCVDVGCGFGYFTIPLARLAGPAGSVTAVDLQKEMLEGVRRRAKESGLLTRIILHRADASGLHLEGRFDAALAFWMVHEVPDQEALLTDLLGVLRTGGKLLIAEPKMHVSASVFQRTVERAEKIGFARASEPRIFFSRAVVMTKGHLSV